MIFKCNTCNTHKPWYKFDFCGKGVGGLRVKCKKCINEVRRKRIALLKEEGLCVKCGKQPAELGKTCCTSCLEEYNNWSKEREAKLYKENMCIECGLYPAEPGKKKCKVCFNKMAEQRRKRRRERKESGICVKCDNPALSGRVSCQTCSDRASNYNKEQRLNDNPKYLFLALRANTRKRKRRIEFKIDEEEFVEWYTNSEKICHYCNREVRRYIREKKGDKLPNDLVSFDRKDNDGIYELPNLVICCKLCNTIKSNIFSYEEWMELAPKYITPKWQVGEI